MDPQIFVNKLPVEIWLHIISFIGESQFDFYFTSKKFFHLAKYFRDPINSKKSKNLIKEAIIRELPCIVNYTLNIIKNNKPEFNNKLFDNLGTNEYFRQCVKHNIHNAVDYFVSKNIDINAVNEFGKTPLITAVKSGNHVMVEKLINCGANFNKHEIYKLAFDYRHDDIFVLLIDKKIESDKFYGKIKDEFGKINVDEVTNLDTNFISKHLNDTTDNPYLELIELVDPKYHEKNSDEFFGHLINLDGELEVERDNFFKMLKYLFIKKINRNGKFYCCIKEMYLMISMKKIICDLLREKCYEDPKIKHFIGSQNIDL